MDERENLVKAMDSLYKIRREADKVFHEKEGMKRLESSSLVALMIYSEEANENISKIMALINSLLKLDGIEK